MAYHFLYVSFCLLEEEVGRNYGVNGSTMGMSLAAGLALS